MCSGLFGIIQHWEGNKQFAMIGYVSTGTLAFMIRQSQQQEMSIMMLIVKVFFGERTTAGSLFFRVIPKRIGCFFFITSQWRLGLFCFILFGHFLLAGIHKRSTYGKP